MEAKEITFLSKYDITLPARFLLVCAMNPCPCGYYGSALHSCNCTPYQIQKYRSRISGPLLDRIDLQIEMPHLSFDEMQQPETKTEFSSRQILEKVMDVAKIQRERFKKTASQTNSDMSRRQIEIFCKLDKTSNDFLRATMEKINFSSRAYDRILKISRTIADLDQKESIETAHIAEAVHYRFLDKQNLIV